MFFSLDLASFSHRDLPLVLAISCSSDVSWSWSRARPTLLSSTTLNTTVRLCHEYSSL